MFSVTENMRKTFLRLRSIFRRNRVEEELDEELRFHLEYQTRENKARGMEEREARRQAFLTLDGLERCKEECRDMRRVNLIDDLFKDLAFAGRTLRKSPLFAAAAAATIALGIGATAAVFSVVNAVLLRPLPYRDSARLVLVLRNNPADSVGVGSFLYSNADFMDLRRGTTGLFEDMGGVASFRAFVPREDGATEQIGKALVTANFFRLLGARVVLGRDFSEADAVPEPPRPGVLIPTGSAAILSYEYWQRRYGGNPGVLGTEMPGSGEGGPRIVGVLAPGFRLFLPPAYRVDAAPDFYVANNGGYDTAHRNLLLAGAIARLKPGITLPQAQERIRAMSPELQKAAFDRKAVLSLEPMRGYLVKQVRPAILSLMGSVIFLMLIACANVANLLLVRTSQRERELAVRAALGGSAWRLMRQMLAEALLLSAVGTSMGVALGVGRRPRVRPRCTGQPAARRVHRHRLARARVRSPGRPGGSRGLRHHARVACREAQRDRNLAGRRTRVRLRLRPPDAQRRGGRRGRAFLCAAHRIGSDVSQLPRIAARRSGLRSAPAAHLLCDPRLAPDAAGGPARSYCAKCKPGCAPCPESRA